MQASCVAGTALDTRFLWLAALLGIIALAIGMSQSRLADFVALLSLGALIYATASNRRARHHGGAVHGQGVQTRKNELKWTLTLIKAEFTQDDWQGA